MRQSERGLRLQTKLCTFLDDLVARKFQIITEIRLWMFFGLQKPDYTILAMSYIDWLGGQGWTLSPMGALDWTYYCSERHEHRRQVHRDRLFSAGA